ncbi:MAG: ribosome assembly cofactor RimP [Candidatus Cloacimonetes bacterium]|nr:ribosome assembly cofactor RimP [Candidatus Cloacimonadota bacterium]
MIKKEQVEKLTLESLSEEYFIVGISISSGNSIDVVIDGDNGVNIQKCVDVSRHIEQGLNRDEEDFELSVYSAGLGQPYKVYRQYLKNQGKEVEVTVKNEKTQKGIIKDVDETGFNLEVKTKEKVEGSNKKTEVVKNYRIAFESNPDVRNIISFK